jgi:hypothetical protein
MLSWLSTLSILIIGRPNMFDTAAKEAGDRFMKYCQEANEAFEELMSYNETDGPLFSQIGAISFGFSELANEQTATLADVVALQRHCENLFTSDLLPDEEWCGAPQEVRNRARTSWHRFKKMADAFI